MDAIEQAQESNEALEKLLTSLLGLDVSVSPTDAATIKDGFVTVYGQCPESIDSLCICDLNLANSAGAALARIPGRVAIEATEAGECPENLWENFSEIMNICSTFARKTKATRLKMHQIYSPSSEMPDSVKEKIPNENQRVVQVSIEGYKPGLFLMCAT